MRTLEHRDDDFTVRFNETPELKEKVYEAVLAYYVKHSAFHGEVIMQCDNPIIDAPSVLATIADDLFKFEVTSKE